MHRLPPLSETLNRAVLALAARHWPNGWKASARDTQPAVTRWMSVGWQPDNWRGVRPFPVWAGASDRTIFGAPAVNHAFRAWHDAWHLRLRAPFTFAGEIAVYEAQRLDLLRYFKPDAERYGTPLSEAQDECLGLLRAEVVGQLQHQSAHGIFPVNQRAFVRAYVRNPQRALARVW